MTNGFKFKTYPLLGVVTFSRGEELIEKFNFEHMQDAADIVEFIAVEWVGECYSIIEYKEQPVKGAGAYVTEVGRADDQEDTLYTPF